MRWWLLIGLAAAAWWFFRRRGRRVAISDRAPGRRTTAERQRWRVLPGGKSPAMVGAGGPDVFPDAAGRGENS